MASRVSRIVGGKEVSGYLGFWVGRSCGHGNRMMSASVPFLSLQKRGFVTLTRSQPAKSVCAQTSHKEVMGALSWKRSGSSVAEYDDLSKRYFAKKSKQQKNSKVEEEEEEEEEGGEDVVTVFSDKYHQEMQDAIERMQAQFSSLRGLKQ